MFAFVLLKKAENGLVINTFVIILQTDITRLNDLSQINMKSTFSIFLRDIGSFGLDVGSQLRSL